VGTILVATDGSELADRSVLAGVGVLRPSDVHIVVTVVDGLDPSLTQDGSGHAGPSMSPDEYASVQDEKLSEGRAVVDHTASLLDVEAVQTRVIEGSPGSALCALAEELSADAIVLGTRGRGGIRRALLGSVSDYVVRNAPCAVVIARADS
jgi:nucleotide-binding universal stress UspA family protein